MLLIVVAAVLGITVIPLARSLGDATGSVTAGDVPTPSPTARPSSTPDRTQPRAATPIRPAKPIEFRSDRLGIDAPVVPVRADGGVLLPPDDPQQLGWWSDGRKPGAGNGRVLITGHTVSTGGGAFDHLDRLRRGDVVDVRTRSGERDYRVSSVTYLTLDQFAARSQRLLRHDGPERLVLVTCDDWDGTTYRGSTVVTATPVAAP